MLKLNHFIAFSALCASSAAYAQDTWVDKQHNQASEKVDKLANKINNWFGEPNPNQPASATLRVMLDNTWNTHDGFKVKPRVRGRLKLPVLEEKMSVVFGDDSLDNEYLDGTHNDEMAQPDSSPNKKRFDGKRSREENASLALRWSDLNQNWGLDTDADIGVRSGDDVYGRVKVRKNFQHRPDLNTQVEQLYRYGIDSKHFARSSAEVKKQQNAQTHIANYAHIDYVDNKNEKGWSWGNVAYRQHDLGGNRRLSYGLQASGAVSGSKNKLNSYGAFVGWRQPIFRPWLFAQTELTYANDRDANRSHYPRGFVRFEAIF